MSKTTRTPLLDAIYRQFLGDQLQDAFARQIEQRYTIGTLERLAVAGDRMVRRAAVLALGLLADYASNATLGRALLDHDRGVRMLADNSIRSVWQRDGSDHDRQRLAEITKANNDRRFTDAIVDATRLIETAPGVAEAWNQRALALFSTGCFRESIRDCEQALELNPYHFQAAGGMAQSHLQLNDRTSALECFRRALRLNPNLEGVRAHVLYLQRTLKSQE